MHSLNTILRVSVAVLPSLIWSHSFDTSKFILTDFEKTLKRDGQAMTGEVEEPLKVSNSPSIFQKKNPSLAVISFRNVPPFFLRLKTDPNRKTCHSSFWTWQTIDEIWRKLWDILPDVPAGCIYLSLYFVSFWNKTPPISFTLPSKN